MNKFWNWIRDDTTGGRVLRLEGPIDEDLFWGDEITPQAFRDELNAEDGDVLVWINSPGGNVFAAAEIYTMLKDYAGTVTVRIASIAATSPLPNTKPERPDSSHLPPKNTRRSPGKHRCPSLQ